MSHIDFLLKRLYDNSERAAVVFSDHIVTSGDLVAEVFSKKNWLSQSNVCPGDPVVLLGDYSIETTALLLALIEIQAIVIPLTSAMRTAIGDLIEQVGPRWLIDCNDGKATIESRPTTEPNQFYKRLQDAMSPGLVLFTSGSSGRPKAVIHDFGKLLKKFERPRPSLSTVNFLMFDHWGGLNTLFHCLSTSSLVVLPESRRPHDICSLIEQFKLELLPTTPSFLNMLLISGALSDYDVSSLRVISYGAEPMPESTLARLHKVLPGVDLRQTYGMIELGVMRAKSMSSDSLWVKLGGEHYDLRVVDGVLQVKSDSAMLGYLNEPSPFTDDGYFITGDLVEQNGEYIRILGRASDLINVGGQKVYPSEVETAILELSDVEDVVVYGEKNPLLGKIVVAAVVSRSDVDPIALKMQIRRHCSEKLQPYMVPVRVDIKAGSLGGERLKRRRSFS